MKSWRLPSGYTNSPTQKLKTMSKTKLLTAMAAVALSIIQVNATDYCVNENGNNGCYATITAAIGVASNGDRIIVEPKAGHAPYVENLNINKSVYIICANDTDKFDVQGTMIITPAVGRSITVVGMHHVGDIAPNGHSPAGTRCSVSFLGCNIIGQINFDYNYFNFTLASSVVQGGVGFRYGKAIGNDITINALGFPSSGVQCAVYVGTDALPSNDTMLIIGNRMHLNGTYYTVGVFAYTNSHFVHIINNLVLVNASASGYGGGIEMVDFKSSLVSKNLILNNTIYSVNALYVPIYFLNMITNSYTEVINNLVIATSCPYGSVYNASGTIAASYNVSNIAWSPSSLDACACNVSNSNTTLDAAGRPQVGSDAINGGSPDFSYYDLNLTVGDAGAYGGSLSQDNFFPITGSTRVFYVNAPRRVNVSGTINIKADSFDR